MNQMKQKAKASAAVSLSLNGGKSGGPLTEGTSGMGSSCETEHLLHGCKLIVEEKNTSPEFSSLPSNG